MPHPPVSHRTLKRASVVAALLLLAFLLLALRILLIQVLDFDRFQKKVIDQLTTESPVRAARGEILDAMGRVLATNRTVYRISVFPGVIAAAQDREGCASLIADGLCAAVDGLTRERVLEHIGHTSELERTVVRQTDANTANAVLAFVAEHRLEDMVVVEAVNAR